MLTVGVSFVAATVTVTVAAAPAFVPSFADIANTRSPTTGDAFSVLLNFNASSTASNSATVAASAAPRVLPELASLTEAIVRT